MASVCVARVAGLPVLPLAVEAVGKVHDVAVPQPSRACCCLGLVQGLVAQTIYGLPAPAYLARTRYELGQLFFG